MLVRLSVLLLLWCLPTLLVAQSRSELEKKRKQKEKEIKITQKILSQTQSKKKRTLVQLRTLNKQIESREELITTLNNEISLLEKQVKDYDVTIKTLSDDIKELKEEYGELIYIGYKNRNPYNKLMYIFASTSFNQAIKRIKYLQQYSSYRKRQASVILKTQQRLTKYLEDLLVLKEDKEKLIETKKEELQRLEEDKNDENDVYASLKSKEGKLKKELRAKQRAARKLNQAIKDLIERELEAERRRLAAKAKKSNTSSKMAMTPEAIKLSADFANNKKNLPWPVQQGYISKSFGVHPHPTLKGITTQNNGVDITTTKGASVRALFNGEVLAVFSPPGMNRVVMIRHGEYFTVYANMDKVSVKKGDKITAKQALGTAFTDQEDGKTSVHLEVWKGKTKLNPKSWLKQ